MAGFCRNCGSPLDDVQAFCAGCGTPVPGPPVRSSAPPPAPPASAPRPQTPPQAAPQPRPAAQAPAAQAATAAPAKSGNTLVKALLIFLVVIFLFGVVGVAGIWYVAHRVKQKVHEIGLDDLSTTANANRGPALGRIDPCSLLSKADVGQAAKMDVVRAEAEEGSEPGCVYNVQGDMADLVAKHASLLRKAETTEAQRQAFESFGKSVFHGTESGQGNSSSNHPGESPVFTFSVSNQSALATMNLTRATLGRLGPGVVTVPNLGDDAIDAGGAILIVRKGDKLIRIMYMMCPCTTDNVLPLAKKIAVGM